MIWWLRARVWTSWVSETSRPENEVEITWPRIIKPWMTYWIWNWIPQFKKNRKDRIIWNQSIIRQYQSWIRNQIAREKCLESAWFFIMLRMSTKHKLTGLKRRLPGQVGNRWIRRCLFRQMKAGIWEWRTYRRPRKITSTRSLVAPNKISSPIHLLPSAIQNEVSIPIAAKQEARLSQLPPS